MMLTDSVGHLAATLVFATFCAQRMTSLRAIAIASNLAFIGDGYLDSLWPILILHVAMLPINVVRCWQSMRSSRSAMPADAGSPAPNGLAVPRNRIAVVGRLRAWRKRGEFRRELSAMSARDFHNLKVPPGLVADELRRWRWQEPSRQWRVVGSKWSATNRDDFADLSHPNQLTPEDAHDSRCCPVFGGVITLLMIAIAPLSCRQHYPDSRPRRSGTLAVDAITVVIGGFMAAARGARSASPTATGIRP
jgi:uncharacterized protein YjiS (DUF1127 family)